MPLLVKQTINQCLQSFPKSVINSMCCRVDCWKYSHLPKTEVEYSLWFGSSGQHYKFKTADDMRDWLDKKAILFRKY